eukprot:2065721-Rhodomonas_salina.1
MMFNVTDFASRMIRCILCFSSRKQPLSAQATAQLYFDHVFRYHGLPNRVQSDRGPQFVAEFFVELWNLCGTRQNLST